MKIAFITPEYSGYGGGIFTFYRHLIDALQGPAAETNIVVGSGFGIERPRERQGEPHVHSLTESAISDWLPRFSHLSATPLLQRLLAGAWACHAIADRLEQPDVIEVSDFPLLAVPHILKPLAPTIVQCHASHGQVFVHDPSPGLELDGAIALALETATLAAASAVQTYSHANARYWSAQAGIEVSCLRPAWSGLPVREAGQPLDQISVFGRIQRWKGPHQLCAALRPLDSTPPVLWHGRDVAMSARGASTDAWLRQQYPDIWGQRVKTASPVPPEQVAAIQSSSRLNLVPSTWDVFNFTVVEAMHSGRPVVCSDGAGASELIEDGRTGFVYDGQSPEALADALKRALALPDARLREIGLQARQEVAHRLDPQRAAAERLRAYQAAIEAHARPRPPVPDWVKQLALPRDPGDESLPFLEQLPLKKLARHVGGRLMRKAGLG